MRSQPHSMHPIVSFMLVAMVIFTTASVLRWVDDTYLGNKSGVQVANAATVVTPPKIRIGLYFSDAPITVTSDSSMAVITVDDHITMQTVLAQQVVTVSYDRTTQLYTVQDNIGTFTSTQAIQVRPTNHALPITITSYTNAPAWNTKLNDNAFWGLIEVHYAPATDKIWVVNQLGIEKYVKGIAEAGNDPALEYLKTLYTAARTYAYYNYLHPTKHRTEPYLLDATPNDQVYRGYNFTMRAPNIVTAVEATRGEIVKYNNDVAITPYFSSSDGNTRSWSDVWNGNVPYLVAVPDPGCAGKTLLGHGVGLSARGAYFFATTQNWDWQKLLQYYYTGVNLEKVW